MKIVLINICDNGSTGRIMLDIMKELRDDVESKAFVSRKYTNLSNVISMHTKAQYRMHKLLATYFGLDEFGSYFATKKVIDQLENIKPDIVHLHNIHNHTINYRLLFEYIKKNNVRTVWTLHDCWAFTGGCFHFERNGCNKWIDGCHDCKFLKDVGMVTPIDHTKRHYDLKKEAFTGVKDMVLVTPSEWLKNLVKQSYLKEYEVKVINNGVNLDKFAHTDEHTFDNVVDRSKKILLGVAMPFTERKGYSDFLKLNDIIDREQYQIVLVGLNEDQIAHLPEGMVGIKRTDNQKQLAELYSIAYAFVNFTYEDTFSMVNIEALACGTPVICYNTGGAVEMLNAQNAIVMKQGAYAELPKYLDAIGLLREKSESNAKLIKIKYSAANMANGYKEIYNRIYRNEL